MKNWELAVDNFISEWKDKDFVLGAILTGSYATGNNTENSDIDIHIVLSDEIKWRERGNKIINGFLIEYFSNPVSQLKKYIEEDYKSRVRNDANMYANGKIIFDKSGIIKQLQKEAKEELNKPFGELSKVSIEFMKYGLFDEFENLKDNYNNDSFNYYYYLYLNELLFAYKNYLGADLPARSKIYKFLTSTEFREKYNLKEFPDKDFIKMYLEAMKIENKKEKYELLSTLKNYTLDKIGNFNIDGWKINSEIEK